MSNAKNTRGKPPTIRTSASFVATIIPKRLNNPPMIWSTLQLSTWGCSKREGALVFTRSFSKSSPFPLANGRLENPKQPENPVARLELIRATQALFAPFRPEPFLKHSNTRPDPNANEFHSRAPFSPLETYEWPNSSGQQSPSIIKTFCPAFSFHEGEWNTAE